MVNSKQKEQILFNYNQRTSPEQSKNFYFLLKECLSHWGIDFEKQFPNYKNNYNKLIQQGLLKHNNQFWNYPSENNVLFIQIKKDLELVQQNRSQFFELLNK